jgi:hypothetical protein
LENAKEKKMEIVIRNVDHENCRSLIWSYNFFCQRFEKSAQAIDFENGSDFEEMKDMFYDHYNTFCRIFREVLERNNKSRGQKVFTFDESGIVTLHEHLIPGSHFTFYSRQLKTFVESAIAVHKFTDCGEDCPYFMSFILLLKSAVRAMDVIDDLDLNTAGFWIDMPRCNALIMASCPPGNGIHVKPVVR